MRHKISQFTRRLLKRSSAGQSLVVLALGFLGLIGFVGIVTDVSLMFVRYTTLVRAVDSASIAAAGQVRRLVPNNQDIAAAAACTGSDCPTPEDFAFARSFANVSIAARQFVEFYGLNPQAVLVDMCASVSKSERQPDGTYIRVPANEEDDMVTLYGELCTEDNRKLIKVTVQVNSPTVFMRLLGFDDITLQAASIAETAVLDVVLVLDVSESMVSDTTYLDWANAGYDTIYLPPNLRPSGEGANPNIEADAIKSGFNLIDPYLTAPANMWWTMVNSPQAWVNNQIRYNNTSTAFNVRTATYPWKGESSYTYTGTSREVREECRVRFWPGSIRVSTVPGDWSNGARDPLNLQRLYYEAFGVQFTRWGGFVPTFDYYGCCNDPDGNGNMGDLLCQPFRQARDATDAFLDRIDFLRGDRVGFVTFDRQAFIVRAATPDGVTHMFDNQAFASQVLNTYIGVRTEPAAYQPQLVSLDGEQVGIVPWQGIIQTDYDYPVRSNCPFLDAALPFPFSNTSFPPGFQAGFSPTLSAVYDSARVPNSLDSIKYPSWAPNSFYSYDLIASCTGTNVGAALREANFAFTNPRTSRVEGTVWIMVLLGDGAAAGTDPIRRNATTNTQPLYPDYPYRTPLLPVEYGGLGLCPAGTQSSPSNLTDGTRQPYVFPYCTDSVPETRHFCGPVGTDPADIHLSMGIECSRAYDPDDYARDWADWVTGIHEDTDAATGLNQLPTIFTIGFGLNFRGGTQYCKRGEINPQDVGDCLGEELLRYIADVGDNWQLDSDYQQSYLVNGILDRSEPEGGWGPRGECEDPSVNPSTVGSGRDLVSPLRAGQSCGNYYNAPGGRELEIVFDEIASRMFSRLTR